MDESGKLRFQVLGPVTAFLDGGPVHLGGPQQRLVLALLLANLGNPLSTNQLIDAVWQDATPATARKTLQVYVSRLRASLGEASVKTALDGYRMVGWLDAKEFEERAARGRERAIEAPREAGEILSGALAMWVGSPYSGFEDNHALYPEIVRLEELRISTLGDRLAADLDTGSSSALIGELESLTREYPLQERFRAQLMLALYRSGRQADALRVFSQTRDRLVEELGVEPGPELWQLEQRILEQDPSLLLQAEENLDRPPLRAIRGYELRELVGAGGSSRVYRAFDRSASRTVMVKVVDPEVSGQSDYIEGFEPTAQLISKLEHPHILPLVDYWREPDGAYLISAWTEGGSLRDALGSGRPWALEPALVLIDQVGSALAYTHRNGVVHGAVKPENILLGDSGSGFLADFPMVVRAEGPYTAPEVLVGDRPTPRSDVYSFGLVIHELFTGALPQENFPSRLLSSGLQDVIAKAVAFAPGERFERIEDLLRDIRRATGSDVVGIAEGPEVRSLRARNPYKGLRAFQETDADDFFGRDELIQLTLDKAAHHRLVALVGPSGSGKSSLVRAGVLPRLRGGVRQRPALITEMFPGNYPFEELESALRRVAVEWPDRGVVEDLTADSRGLLRVVKQILPDDNSVLILVIDQFEELFSLLDDEVVRASFLESLATVVDDAHSRTVVIITLRADFFDRPLTYPQFGMLLEQGVVPVTVPSRQGLAQAVSQPARQAGIDLEDGLVADIVSDFEHRPGALPLMQFTLTEMVDAGDGDRLTVDAYKNGGGIGGAVGSRAEDVYVNLTDSGKEALKQALLRMVRVDAQGAYTRRRVRQAELVALGVDQPALLATLRNMASHRLLTFDRDPITRGATIEVAHEALLESWPRLRKWIEDRRHDLLLHHRFTEARRDWLANDSDHSFLLTGGRLAQFENWARDTQLRLTPDERAFLDESQSAKRAKDRRQRRLRIGVTSMVALLVTIGLVFGLTAQRQRAASERQEILRLAESALVTVEEKPERSMLVALAAADRSLALDGTVPDQVLQALHESLLRSRLLRTTPQGGVMALSNDGSMLAVAEDDEEVALLDPKDLSHIRNLAAVGRPVNALAFGSEGTLYAVDEIGNVYRWDLADPDSVDVLIQAVRDSSASWFLDVSSDGGLVALGHDEADRVIIHNPHTNETVESLSFESPTSARFSPDASTLAVSTTGGETILVNTSTWEVDAAWQPGRGGDVIRTAVTQVNWSPQGDRLVVATEAAGTYVLGTSLDPAPPVDTGLFPRSVQFDEMGAEVVIGDTDGTARVLDVQDPSQPRRLASLGGHTREVTGVLFLPGGSHVITTSEDGITRQWDPTPTGQHEYLTLMAHPSTGKTGTPTFSPDGSRLLTKSGDAGEATVWDTATWKPITTFDGLPSTSGQLVFSPDGSMVAVAQGESHNDISTIFDNRLDDIPTRVGIFDSTTGELLIELGGHSGHIAGRAFAPDGRRFLTAGLDGQLILWDLTNGEALDSRLSEHGRMNLITFNPEGDRAVVGNEDGTFTIWKVTADDRLEVGQTVEAHGDGLVFARFSPSGDRIATTSADGTGRIWTVRGELLTQLDGHTSIAWNLNWAPDGKQLVTVSLDETLRIWDASTGDLRVTLTALGTPAGADVSPEGLMAVGANDGTVYILTLNPEELVDLARERAQPEDCALFDIEPCPVETP